jgi:hypothetical protein
VIMPGTKERIFLPFSREGSGVSKKTRAAIHKAQVANLRQQR